MLRGYRLYIAAIGLALAGATPPNEKPVNKATPQQVNPPPTLAPDYTPNPDKQDGGCYSAKNPDSADLCAQLRAAIAAERAADTARWGNIIAGVAAALSFASIILVLRALRQTDESLKISQRDRATATRRAIAQSEESKEALGIARQNADAASVHAKIAETTADHQLRPYLAIEKILPEKPTLETDTIQIVFKNFGQTPAQNIRKEMGVAFAPVGIDSWPIPIAKIDLGREIAPGHSQKSTIELSLWGEEWAKVVAGEGSFRIFLRVAYDGLGIERAPLEASIIYSMHGAMVAVSKITGPIEDGSELKRTANDDNRNRG